MFDFVKDKKISINGKVYNGTLMQMSFDSDKLNIRKNLWKITIYIDKTKGEGLDFLNGVIYPGARVQVMDDRISLKALINSMRFNEFKSAPLLFIEIEAEN